MGHPGHLLRERELVRFLASAKEFAPWIFLTRRVKKGTLTFDLCWVDQRGQGRVASEWLIQSTF